MNKEELINKIKEVEEDILYFYKDESNDFEDRWYIYDEFAPIDSSINYPFDIMETYMNMHEYHKYENVYYERVIEWWIDTLRKGRIIRVDYDEVLQKNRLYTPSHKALDRLERIWKEKLLQLDYKGFRYDW